MAADPAHASTPPAEAPPSRRRWAGRGMWALADQGFFAGANFLVAVGLAAWLSEHDYGAFTTAYASFLAVGIFTNALLTEPMVVFGSKKYRGRLPQYLGKLVGLHLVLTLAGALVLGAVAAWVWTHSHPLLGQALAALAVIQVSQLLPWMTRVACYIESDPRPAAVSGALYLVVVLGLLGLFYWMGHLRVVEAIFIMGAAGLVANVYLIVQVEGGPARGLQARRLRVGRRRPLAVRPVGAADHGAAVRARAAAVHRGAGGAGAVAWRAAGPGVGRCAQGADELLNPAGADRLGGGGRWWCRCWCGLGGRGGSARLSLGMLGLDRRGAAAAVAGAGRVRRAADRGGVSRQVRGARVADVAGGGGAGGGRGRCGGVLAAQGGGAAGPAVLRLDRVVGGAGGGGVAAVDAPGADRGGAGDPDQPGGARGLQRGDQPADPAFGVEAGRRVGR